jgi:predicted ATPase
LQKFIQTYFRLRPPFAEEENQMRRFIITGAPGAGKTAIIRQLELDGFSVVEEAATDVIAAAQAHGSTVDASLVP